MRKLVVLAVLIIAAAFFARARMPSATTPPVADESSATRRVDEYFAAIRRGDLAAIDHTLADDYTVIGADGKLESKSERIAWLKDNMQLLTSITPTEIRVRTYGNTVVATGLVAIEGDSAAPTAHERFMHVWVHRDTAWRVVAGQITKVSPTQPVRP